MTDINLKESEVITFSRVVAEINEAIATWEGEELAELYNRIIDANLIKYIEDGLFEHVK